MGRAPGGKLTTTNRPTVLMETTLAARETSGVTMVLEAAGAGAAGAVR